jgi:uncharacterized protein
MKNIKWFSWNPNIDLLAVFVSWVLVVSALSSSTYIVTAQNGGLYFIFYAIICATLFGIGIPLLWTVFNRKRALSNLGITTKNLKISLLAQIVLSVILYLTAYRDTQLPSFNTLAPLVALALAIGFFEAVFWRGWVLNRLEESFGLIPAILLGSFLYAIYHIGYGMPVSEMTFLFFIGIMFAIVFRFTRSVFILWPFFQPIGQLVTLLKDGLPLPLIAALGFGEVLIVMLALCWFSVKVAQKRGLVLSS